MVERDCGTGRRTPCTALWSYFHVMSCCPSLACAFVVVCTNRFIVSTSCPVDDSARSETEDRGLGSDFPRGVPGCSAVRRSEVVMHELPSVHGVRLRISRLQIVPGGGRRVSARLQGLSAAVRSHAQQGTV